MSFLPVAERELRIRARQPGTYRLRMVIVGLGALILLGAMVSFRSSPAAVGGDMFHSFTVLAALFCLYEGARLTSDSLSEELREGTMGLLFLTRLQPYGILAGKLVSAGLSSFYGLMALFPVASLPLLMGGVTGTEVWRTMLALMNLLFFALAAGMAVSAYARDQFNAWAGTGLLLVLVCFLPTALSALLPGRVNFLEQLTPLSNCLAAASPGSSASKFWQGILAGQIFAWLFLFVAGGALKRRWRILAEGSRGNSHASQNVLRRLLRKPRENRSRTDAARRALVDNPVQWLAALRSGSPAVLWIVCGLGCIVVIYTNTSGSNFAAAQMPVVGFVNLAFKLIMAVAAARGFAETKRDGVFELLITTPTLASTIVAGHRQALRKLFAAPLATWMTLSIGLPLVLQKDAESGLGMAGFTLLGHLVMIIDLAAIRAAGLWFGATTGKTHVAAVRAFILVVLLPWVLIVIPCVGTLFVVLSPVWSILVRKGVSLFLDLDLPMVIRDPTTDKYASGWWRNLWDLLPPQRSRPPYAGENQR